MGGENLIENYWKVNGALWQLKVLWAFYLMFALLMPLFRKSAIGGTLVCNVVLIIICELMCRQQFLFDLGQIISYVFYIGLGLSFYSLIVLRENALLSFISITLQWYGIVQYNIIKYNPDRFDTGSSFGVSAMYAILVFLIFLLADPMLPNAGWVKKISAYSYGLYVQHMPMSTIIWTLLAKSNEKNLTDVRVYFVAVVTIVVSTLLTFAEVHWVDSICKEGVNIVLKAVNRVTIV